MNKKNCGKSWEFFSGTVGFLGEGFLGNCRVFLGKPLVFLGNCRVSWGTLRVFWGTVSGRLVSPPLKIC